MNQEDSKPKEAKPGSSKDTSPTEDKGEDQKGNKRSGPPWYRRPVIVGIVVAALIVVVLGVLLIWRHSRTHVTTDDAYVDGVPQLVSPQVSGRVVRVLVDDNQDVRAGQELIELDPSDYQSRLDQARAAGAQADA